MRGSGVTAWANVAVSSSRISDNVVLDTKDFVCNRSRGGKYVLMF